MSDQDTKMSDQDNKPLEASTAAAAPVESTEAAPAPAAELAATTEDASTKTEEEKPATDANESNTNEVSVLNPPKNMLRVKRDVGADGNTKANKFDPTVLKETSDPVQIRSQVHSPCLPRWFCDRKLTLPHLGSLLLQR